MPSGHVDGVHDRLRSLRILCFRSCMWLLRNMCSKPWGPIQESYAAASCARICLLASPQSTLQDKITAQELLDLCGADVALAVAVIAEAFLRDASVRFNPGLSGAPRIWSLPNGSFIMLSSPGRGLVSVSSEAR